MSYRYQKVDQVWGKVDWEGGLYETAFGYGLSAADISPEGETAELHVAWKAMEDSFNGVPDPITGRPIAFGDATKAVEDILSDCELGGHE